MAICFIDPRRVLSIEPTATANVPSPRRSSDARQSEVLLPHAITSVFHQRHFGRVLRSSRNVGRRRLASYRTIDAARKYVAELVPGDLGTAIQQLKRKPGKGLFVAGVKLPLALAELGLIDEYEFVVQPTLVGHGPTLFAGLSKRIDLRLVSRLEFGSGAVAMRYEPRT